MRINGYDLAGLSFRARDALNAQLDRLKGQALGEGEQVAITLTATVTRTTSGGLIFGDVSGRLGDG